MGKLPIWKEQDYYSEQLNYYLLFCLDITEVSPKKLTNFVMELAPKAN